MRVIGITGLAGSGKTTIARYLMQQCDYARIRFADPLKAMLRELGLSDDELDGASKMVRSELICGKTPREAMQTLGTEWGRQMIGPDVWVNAWRKRVDWQAIEGAPGIVADDVRFPNEVGAIYKYGGIIVHVTMPGLKLDAAVAAHESEAHEFGYDVHIINDGNFSDLFRKVDHRVVNYFATEKAA